MLRKKERKKIKLKDREVKRKKETDRQTDRQTKKKLTHEILVAWTFSVRFHRCHKLAKLRTRTRANRNKLPAVLARPFSNFARFGH